MSLKAGAAINHCVAADSQVDGVLVFDTEDVGLTLDEMRQFFAQRDSQNVVRMSKETPREREARKDRQRAPPLRQTVVYVWSMSKKDRQRYVRERVLSQSLNRQTIQDYEPECRRYNAHTNEWDLFHGWSTRTVRNAINEGFSSDHAMEEDAVERERGHRPSAPRRMSPVRNQSPVLRQVRAGSSAIGSRHCSAAGGGPFPGTSFRRPREASPPRRDSVGMSPVRPRSPVGENGRAQQVGSRRGGLISPSVETRHLGELSLARVTGGHVQRERDSIAECESSPGNVDLRLNTVRVAQGGGLQRTDHLIKPHQRPRALDGLVAAMHWNRRLAWTSPNQTYVPEFPLVDPGMVGTRVDGRWGPQEYTLWPQLYAEPFIHHMCIPRRPTKSGLPEVVWRRLRTEDWSRDFGCGVPDLGFLKAGVLNLLTDAATGAIERFQQVGDGKLESKKGWGSQLVLTLRHCIDRLRILPSSDLHVVALATHAQRVMLEIEGYTTYLDVVRKRYEEPTFQATNEDVLDVRGVFVEDPSLAQKLFRLGIPFWLQQPITDRLVIFDVVDVMPVSSILALQPGWPPLSSGGSDLAEAFSDPARLTRMICDHATSALCDTTLARLPDLGPEGSRGPSATDVCSRTGGSKTTAVSVGAGHSAAVGPTAKRDADSERQPGLVFQRTDVRLGVVWETALRSMGYLGTARSALRYYFPPPYMFRRDDGKLGRYVHNYIRIRAFCRQRLLDPSIAGEPLTLAEWRDALWGDYSVDPAGATMATGRRKRKFERRQGARRLLAANGALSSYDPNQTPLWNGEPVTADHAAHSEQLLEEILWEVHETNWRCELRDLDVAVTGIGSGDGGRHWERERQTSEVWGKPSSVLTVVPRWEDGPGPFCWTSPPSPGWEEGRPCLSAFISVLRRWPGAPPHFGESYTEVLSCSAVQFQALQRAAVEFYVATFIDRYGRLPVAPVIPAGRIA